MWRWETHDVLLWVKKKTGLALRCCCVGWALGPASNRMRIQTWGIMDEEWWTFPGMKTGSCRRVSPCRSHGCIFLHRQTQEYCTVTSVDPLFFEMLQLSKRICEESLFVLGCLSLRLLVPHFQPLLSPSLPAPPPFTSAPLSGSTSITPSAYQSICNKFCYLYRKLLNRCWLNNFWSDCVYVTLRYSNDSLWLGMNVQCWKRGCLHSEKKKFISLKQHK